MSTRYLLGSVLFVSSAALVGCGSSSSTGSTTTTTGAGMHMFDPNNGCDPSTAEDHTKDTSPPVITFPGSDLSYSPNCIKMAKNHQVQFSGPFSSHPLVGGLADSSGEEPDPNSPFCNSPHDGKTCTPTSDGTMASFNLPESGTFGFYCQVHGELGMRGAIFVE